MEELPQPYPVSSAPLVANLSTVLHIIGREDAVQSVTKIHHGFPQGNSVLYLPILLFRDFIPNKPGQVEENRK